MILNKRLHINYLLFVFLLGAAVTFIWNGSNAAQVHAMPLNLQRNELSVAATTECSKPTFFGLIPWYQYLKVTQDPSLKQPTCTVGFNLAGNGGSLSNLNEIWLIALAVFDDLLRIAGVVAVVFVIYGGIRYTTSQGESEATKAAQGTIINALIGLAIAVVAATTVAFIGSSLGG